MKTTDEIVWTSDGPRSGAITCQASKESFKQQNYTELLPSKARLFVYNIKNLKPCLSLPLFIAVWLFCIFIQQTSISKNPY